LIDDRLFEPLTLTGLAAVAGLSAYHFTRQFGARFGDSPMVYVRTRRLAAAANRLCGDAATSLVDLAFDCGFDSQEGFTRAFKRLFGVPPGRYRRAGQRPSPMETLLLSPGEPAPVVLNLTQSARPVRKPGLRIAGLSALFDETTKSGIPGLWDRFTPRLPIAGQVDYGTYGVCAAAPGREPGSLRYMAGVALAADAPVPDGLKVIDLAPQSYLVFRQTVDGSPLHPQMQAATKAIWGDRVPRSGLRLVQAPDLEVYPGDFDPTRPGSWVEWWLPVEA
jgi:AraC family transcriptional regulator